MQHFLELKLLRLNLIKVSIPHNLPLGLGVLISTNENLHNKL